MSWIKCEDQLPPNDKRVLIHWKESSDIDAEFDYLTTDEDCSDIWANFHTDPPDYWMYIPRHPELN